MKITVASASTDPSRKNDGRSSAHDALKFFLAALQFTGIFPLQGIFSSPENLRFRWLSFQVLNTLYLLLSIIICMIVAPFIYSFIIKYNYDKTTTFLLAVALFSSIYLFVRLAMDWPQLIQKWCVMDKRFNSVYGYPENLNLRINLIMVCYVAVIAGEYVLSWATNSDSALAESSFNSTSSATQLPKTIPDIISEYTIGELVGIVVIAIPALKSLAIVRLNDLLIILISIPLALRFKQIAQRLAEDKDKANDVAFWIEIRRDYSELGNLCREVNEKLSHIVLVSFTCNIYLMLVELYNIISIPLEQDDFVYSVYSLGVNIMRLLLVFFYASWLNDESRRPIRILYAVSSKIYNIEIRRWLMQMQLDSIALTGQDLFKVTRGLILSIAGAVVSYELIFIQFKDQKE